MAPDVSTNNTTSCDGGRMSLFRGLGRTLLLWFLLLSLGPLAIVSLLSHSKAAEALREHQEQALLSVTAVKTEYLDNVLAEILTDLAQQAEDVSNARFLTALEAAYTKSGAPLADFVRSQDHAGIVAERAADLRAFRQRYGCHDILLIDTDGNILFIVAGEADTGTNILRGKYSDTHFGRVCREVMKTGQTGFSDLERYAPSDNAVAGFFVSALVSDKKDRIGLMAFQMPTASIDAIMKGGSGLGQTGETYLVGADLRMRSNSRLNENETILTSADTELSRLWRDEHTTGDARGRTHGEELLVYTGRRGRRVLGLHHPITVAGVPLAVIAEIEES